MHHRDGICPSLTLDTLPRITDCLKGILQLEDDFNFPWIHVTVPGLPAVIENWLHI